jgi:hypothetical protein
MINLVFAVTDNYLDRASHFFKSLRAVKSARILGVCNGFTPAKELTDYHSHIEWHTMDRCPTESCGMIQHGRFLDALPFLQPNDLIVLSDADIIVQRDFSADEKHLFEKFDQNTISAGPNDHRLEFDNLYQEARRISIKFGFLGTYHPTDFEKIPVWNCGLLVGRAGLFRRIQESYEQDCTEFYNNCDHRSRCQFQFWHAWHRMAGPKTFKPLSMTTHAHGHFGRPPDIEFRQEYYELDSSYSVDQVVYYHNFKIMFRHYM